MQEVHAVKARRQMKILEIIRNQLIETQEELARYLRKEGIEVTQATVSRDIKELNLVKAPTGDGRYRYSIPEDQQAVGAAEKFKRLFADCCLSLDFAENIVVIKTLSGTAPGVGEAVDAMRIGDIIGSVAGDNTVLLVVRSRTVVQEVVERLRGLMR
jgi:transcriptional regulator of arginine metabolism